METIIGAVAICKKGNKYLMLKHKDGFWSFPGGKVEDCDKSIAAGLEREIYEETGLTTDSYSLIKTPVINKFTYGYEKPKRSGKSGETHYFLMQLSNNTEIKPLSEIIEVAWLYKSEVMKNLLNEDMKIAFEKACASQSSLIRN